MMENNVENKMDQIDVEGLEQTNTVEVEEKPEEEVEGERLEQGDAPEVGEADMFPRAYVEKLRKENASYRERAGRVGDLEVRLHEALVRLDGRLADPNDLEFEREHLEDGDALEAAITGLVEAKPGLRARAVSGDVGAGARGAATAEEVDLIGFIRGL